MISAIAMTEPAAGSDLRGIKTRAEKKGDHFVLNGSKTFITNGWHADLVIVVARPIQTKAQKARACSSSNAICQDLKKTSGSKLGLKSAGHVRSCFQRRASADGKPAQRCGV